MKTTLMTGNEAGIDLSPSLLRRHVLRMAYCGQSVHIPCAFSIIEIVSVLYSKFLRYDPHDPRHPGRDYLVLSKGHGVMALYAAFRQIGWLKQESLEKYFSDGSALHGLGEHHIPGLEVTSGSLGHGLPVAVGVAFGLKRREASSPSGRQVYCLVGDGEMNEGPMWESLLLARQHHLDNLTIIVDINGFQAMGRTGEILDLEPLQAKFDSFGFETWDIDGHQVSELERALSESARSKHHGKPKAILARTIKGQGVSFMAGDNQWHYTRLTDDDYRNALAELDREGGGVAK